MKFKSVKATQEYTCAHCPKIIHISEFYVKCTWNDRTWNRCHFECFIQMKLNEINKITNELKSLLSR